MPRLEIQNVSKTYRGGVRALDAFTLALECGVHGLLGPNGAGKSTLMRMLATVSRPSDGTITWDGVDVVKSPDALRARLGYLPQDFGVYPNLTVVEFLEYMGAVKGVEGAAVRRRTESLLELTNLTAVKNRRLGGFSGGMRQRVGICQALLNDPQLLIVDEPTAGLDPEERLRFSNLLTELAAQRIVLLSTHIVADVEAVAETLTVVHQGRLRAHATPEGLLESVKGRVWQVFVPGDGATPLPEGALVASTLRRDGGSLIRVVADDRPTPDAEPSAPTLLDAYLEHVNRADRSSAPA